MVFQSSLDGLPLTLSLRAHSLTVGIDERLVVAWDLGGRLYSYFHDEQTCRRSLGGTVLRKVRVGSRRHWTLLSGAGADAVVHEGASVAARVLEAHSRPGWEWTPAPSTTERAGISEGLGRAARFTAEAARADAAEFSRLYEPIGILPPDQYLSIVLQATHGCSFNTCTFCDLHHGGYAVKTPDEFARHARAVLDWLGGSVALRRRAVFVGSANALAVPMPRLTALLASLRGAFAGAPPPLYAFVDGFTGARKSEDDYRALRGLGLTRVYVGLESGHDPLLEYVRKPGRAADAVATVEAITRAGVGVAVIVMTGLGGERFAEAHVADTIATLAAMPLGAGDLVYFSELVAQDGTAYPLVASRDGIRPLTPDACADQRDRMARAVREAFPAPPRMATYDVREFVY